MALLLGYRPPMPSPLNSELAQLVAAKLASGVLPSTLPISVIRSMGSGVRCAGCDVPIGVAQIETECTFAGGHWLRLHLACFREWWRQRAT